MTTKGNTTICISRETKKLLDALKLIPEESNESVLKRILEKDSK